MKTPTVLHRVLSTTSPDPILHHLGPLGLAASIGSCLVVDLDRDAPPLGGRTLADVIEDGPEPGDLRPFDGVAVIGSGGIGYREAAPILDELIDRWPAVVIRSGAEDVPAPLVPILPLLPVPFRPSPQRCAIQLTARGQRAPTSAIPLPPLRRPQIHAMLAGRIEPRWRWVRAFRDVWGASWE